MPVISNRPDQVKTAVKVSEGPCIEGGRVANHMTHLTLDLQRRVTETCNKIGKCDGGAKSKTRKRWHTEMEKRKKESQARSLETY